MSIQLGPMQTVEPPALLDVRALSRLLRCSPRHVSRLARSGRMPAPIRLGVLVRWDRNVIRQWIADGCSRVRKEDVK